MPLMDPPNARDSLKRRYPDPDPEMYIRRITLRVPDDIHDSLMRVARSRGTSMNDLGVRILLQYLAAQETQPVHDWLDEQHDRHDLSTRSLLRRTGPVS
jgi:hypothetical protein